MVRVILAFLAAVVVTEVVAAAAATQFVIHEIVSLGYEVGLGDRLATTFHDILGMASIYLPIIAVGELIAFGVAALVVRYLLPGWQRVGYPLAGFAALVAAIALMISLFDITPIAAARSNLGILVQGLAGALGGLVFVLLLPARAAGEAAAA